MITNDFRSVLRFVKEGKEERRELIINSVERPNGELISLTTRAQTGSESQSVIARVNGSKAVLELTINQTKQQNVVEWDSKVRGPFAIEQSMMRNPMKDNESRLIRLLDPFSGRIVESRLDANAKYKSPIMLGKSKMLRETKVTTRDGGALNESTLWADEDGVILKSYIQSGDLRIFQVGEETYKEVESAFDLSFSTNRIMPLAIKPGKREAYLDAIEMENQVIYKFEQKRSDPYKSISNRCNQRKKSLDAFTSEITVFRLKNREELPAGVESSDEPTPSDLDLSGWLDAGNPIFNKMYVDFLLQFEDDDLHLKVLSAAKRLSEKFESVGFNNDVRKLAVALSTNRLNSVEQSMALIALLRKDKIPARLALGYVYDRNASEPTMVFQAWVEYHHAEWWWPIDPVNPTKTGMLDRIKLKELTSSSSDVRREITKVLELGNDGVVSYKD
ncbi:MAG: transglutaminase domain-containing protein [Pirellula sp.]